MSSKSSVFTYYACNEVASHGGDTNWHNGVTPPGPTTFSGTLVNSVTGGENPRWRDHIRAGMNATTSLSGTKYFYVSDPMFYRASANVYGNPTQEPGHTWIWIYGSHRVVPPHLIGSMDPSVSSRAGNLASTQFYKNYEKQATLLSGGVFLGELAETLRLIKNPAKALRQSIGDYLSHVKKRRRGTPAQRQEFLADSWLEFSFGWVPLINDINDAMDYAQKRQRQLERTRVFVNGSGTAASATAYPQVNGSSGLKARWANYQQYACSVRYFAAIDATSYMDKVSLEGKLSSVGLAPRNFVPTLWELLPWSFVVDYFSNIGDVITALSNGQVRFSWGYKTQEDTVSVYSDGVGFAVDPGATYHFFTQSVRGGRTLSSKRTVTRVPVNSAPIPDISFEVPGFGTKWLNLAALAKKRLP